jgi:hypothetical protein
VALVDIGWITAMVMISDEAPATQLVTDQFNLTFNRALSAGTDVCFRGTPTLYALPRQAVAKESIRTHGDSFDFLVFLSSFD